LSNESVVPSEERGWFVSSFTNGNASCVQIRFAEQGAILVRDSKDRRDTSPIIAMPSRGWTALLKTVNNS